MIGPAPSSIGLGQTAPSAQSGAVVCGTSRDRKGQIFQYKQAADLFATSCEGVSLDNGEAPGHQPGPEAVPTSQAVASQLSF
jgi:hypothetical protein